MKTGYYKNREEALEDSKKWSDQELIMQQVFQAGCIVAAQDILDGGATEEKARHAMGECRRNLELLNDIAKERGVEFKLEV